MPGRASRTSKGTAWKGSRTAACVLPAGGIREGDVSQLSAQQVYHHPTPVQNREDVVSVKSEDVQSVASSRAVLVAQRELLRRRRAAAELDIADAELGVAIAESREASGRSKTTRSVTSQDSIPKDVITNFNIERLRNSTRSAASHGSPSPAVVDDEIEDRDDSAASFGGGAFLNTITQDALHCMTPTRSGPASVGTPVGSSPAPGAGSPYEQLSNELVSTSNPWSGVFAPSSAASEQVMPYPMRVEPELRAGDEVPVQNIQVNVEVHGDLVNQHVDNSMQFVDQNIVANV